MLSLEKNITDLSSSDWAALHDFLLNRVAEGNNSVRGVLDKCNCMTDLDQQEIDFVNELLTARAQQLLGPIIKASAELPVSLY
jgi:hypothetical protein